MMDAVRGALVALLCAGLLRAALELLLPEGTVKRCARFAFGLVMTVLLLEPVLELLRLLGEG